MIQLLLEGEYRDVEVRFVDCRLSENLSSMGRASVRKSGRLVLVVFRSVWRTVRFRPDLLYYHPAGANLSAVARDLALLVFLRPLVSRTVFHAHSRGLVDAINRLPQPLRALARILYSRPDAAVGPSAVAVKELDALSPRISRVIPNATAGSARGLVPQSRTIGPIRILFMSLVSEAKGASWLLDAFHELIAAGHDVRLDLVGEFDSERYRVDFNRQVAQRGLTPHVGLHAPMAGSDKWSMLAGSHVLCVPSIHPRESFGLILAEAASCGLAIVAADIPGVREVLLDGQEALLADPEDRSTLSAHLIRVVTDFDLRVDLGRRAYRAYLERYTPDRFWAEVERLLHDVSVA